MPHHLSPSPPPPGKATVTVFASPTSWIESDAVAQCHQVAALDGMIHVAAMPDLHPGKGAPDRCRHGLDGAVPAPGGLRHRLRHRRVPDRACKRAVPERLARRFPDLDRDPDPDDPAWALVDVEVLARSRRRPRDGRPGKPLRRAGPDRRPCSEPGHAERLGLRADDLVLIVHSGSRGLGERILRSHTDRSRRRPGRRSRRPTWPLTTRPYGGRRSTVG